MPKPPEQPQKIPLTIYVLMTLAVGLHDQTMAVMAILAALAIEVQRYRNRR